MWLGFLCQPSYPLPLRKKLDWHSYELFICCVSGLFTIQHGLWVCKAAHMASYQKISWKTWKLSYYQCSFYFYWLLVINPAVVSRQRENNGQEWRKNLNDHNVLPYMHIYVWYCQKLSIKICYWYNYDLCISFSG